MTHKTINREKSINLLRQLMQPTNDFRIVRLLGEAKLGKSHLLTKVFPSIARQDCGAHCAILDLRGGGQAIADVLYTACNLLSGLIFQGYYDAYQEWVSQSRLQVSGLKAVFSLVQIRSAGEAGEIEKAACHLTSRFVGDLRCQIGTPVLLLFDAVDSAAETTKRWLMDTLLVQLSTLSHVRVVVAGRSVPEASGSYAAMCRSYQLLPVDDEEAYVAFCREIGVVGLGEQSIRDMARVFDYKPGMFVDYVVPKFAHKGTLCG